MSENANGTNSRKSKYRLWPAPAVPGPAAIQPWMTPWPSTSRFEELPATLRRVYSPPRVLRPPPEEIAAARPEEDEPQPPENNRPEHPLQPIRPTNHLARVFP